MIKIKDLGLIDFNEAWAIQNRYVDEVILSKEKNFLLLCEHPSVLTLGRLADRRHILSSDDELQRRHIEVISINRGGEVTLHSPGQLIIYPVVNLEKFGKDLHQYLYKLEQVGIDFLGLFGIVGERISGKTGVWIGNRKIISIGVGVRKWIAFHGMSVNISNDLDLFQMINPCGMKVAVTSVEKEKNCPISMGDVKEKITNIFQQQFRG